MHSPWVLFPSLCGRFPKGRTVSQASCSNIYLAHRAVYARQKNMDYCFCQTAMFFTGLMLIFVLYNVWCHYHIHMPLQFEKSPGLSLPAELTIIGGISQFHIHGHRRECYLHYSPNFVFGAGWQLGEVIESLWPAPNKISDSTQGMTTGHRQEVIDDHLNDSNWNKLIGLGTLGRCDPGICLH